MDNFYEHIDDYKNGLLQGELLSSFESAMKKDSSLALAVENYDTAKSISEGLLEIDMQETLDRLKSDDNVSTENDRSPEIADRSPQNKDHRINTAPKSQSTIFSIRKFMAAASVIIILLIAGWWMMKSNAEMERKEFVMAQIWELRPSDPDATKSIDADIAGMDNFQKGKYFFALNDFEKSAEWLELMISEEKDKKMLSEGHYWLGHAYVQLGRFEDAEKAWRESEDKRVEKMLKALKK